MSHDAGSSHGKGRRHSRSGFAWEDEDDSKDVEMSWDDVDTEDGEDKNESEFDEPERYEVESVISRKIDENGKEKFLIQWKGYSKPTWEPRENLDGCDLLLDSFYKMARDTEPEVAITGVPTDDDFKQKLMEAHQSSMHLNIDLYDKLILKRGIKDTGDIGPKIETVPIVAFGGIARQSSTSSSSSRSDRT